jgi:hypothetical protein
MSDERVHRGPVSNVAAGVVVIAMVIAALSMWTVVPFTWIYIASQLSSSQAPSTGPYMLVFVGVITSIVLLGWLLGRLNRLYIRITGTHTVAPIRPAWMKSMRDEPGTAGNPTVLEAVIVASVGLAILALVLWFFILAGSPLPSQ